MSTSAADQQADLVQPAAPELQQPSTPNSAKKKRKPRVILTPQHMNTLIASYRLHYAQYSSSRDNVTQLVPSSVWKKVYNDFIGLYPEAALFDNEHLKARVRNALKELESAGNSSVADLVQQNEQILKRLKMTGASPLMQQILWRNHNAEMSSQQKPTVAVTVPPPPIEKLAKTPAPAPSSAPSPPMTIATTPSSNEGELQAVQQSQPSSVQVSQTPPSSSESDSEEAANQNGPVNGNPAPKPVSNTQREPLAARLAPTTPTMGKKALMQTQTTALLKMSHDFTKACTGIMEFLEIHKAKAKQEETKVMLTNYEKACNMGVITLEEMKSKARKLLDM